MCNRDTTCLHVDNLPDADKGYTMTPNAKEHSPMGHVVYMPLEPTGTQEMRIMQQKLALIGGIRRPCLKLLGNNGVPIKRGVWGMRALLAYQGSPPAGLNVACRQSS